MVTKKKDLIKELVRGGNSKKDAIKLQKANLKYLNRVYKNSTTKQKANIARTLGSKK